MKKILHSAVICALSLCFAEAASVEFSGYTWTTGTDGAGSGLQLSADSTKLSPTKQWCKDYAYMDNLGITLTAPGDSFSFSYDYAVHASQSALTLTILEKLGENSYEAHMMGYAGYGDRDVSYSTSSAITTPAAFFYKDYSSNTFGTMQNIHEDVSIAKTVNGEIVENALTLSGVIRWDDEENQFVMTLTSTQGDTVTTKTDILLGETVNIDALTFSGEGSSANWISNFTMKTVKANASIPEPATATLSLLALAGLAARRRRK